VAQVHRDRPLHHYCVTELSRRETPPLRRKNAAAFDHNDDSGDYEEDYKDDDYNVGDD
jgi:hypothetical protein